MDIRSVLAVERAGFTVARQWIYETRPGLTDVCASTFLPTQTRRRSEKVIKDRIAAVAVVIPVADIPESIVAMAFSKNKSQTVSE